MTEEILRIKAEELATIRLVFGKEKTVEMELPKAAAWAASSADDKLRVALIGLIDGLAYFSRKGVDPSVEFVIPVRKPQGRTEGIATT
jgi:hypothetical protein